MSIWYGNCTNLDMVHVTVTFTDSNISHCNISEQLSRDLRAKENDIFLLHDLSTNTTILVPWGGNICGTDAVEVPRIYATLNGMTVTDEFTLMRIAIAHNVHDAVDVSVIPATPEDWNITCAHRVNLESIIITQLPIVYEGQHCRFQLSPSQFVTLEVTSFTSSSSHKLPPSRPARSAHMLTAASNSGLCSSTSVFSSEWLSSMFDSAAAAVDNALSFENGADGSSGPPPIALSPNVCTPVGRLVANTAISVAPPPLRTGGDINPDGVSSSQEAKGDSASVPLLSVDESALWQNQAFRQMLCSACASQPLHVLPMRFMGTDTSYFPPEHHNLDKPPTEWHFDESLLALSAAGSDMLDNETDCSTAEGINSGEDFCSVVVHPLLLLTAEEMCLARPSGKGEERRGELLCGILSPEWKKWLAVHAQDPGMCLLGKVEIVRRDMLCRQSTHPAGSHRSSGVRREDYPEARCKPLAPSAVVRVLLSNRIRPNGIHVSKELRLSLGIGDFELVSLTLLDPVQHPPSRPARIAATMISWNVLSDPQQLNPPQSLSTWQSVETMGCDDISTLCHQFQLSLTQARSKSMKFGPLIVSSSIVLPISIWSPQADGARTAYVWVCFDQTCEKSTSGSDDNPLPDNTMKYSMLHRSEDFILFVVDCCAALRESCSQPPVSLTVTADMLLENTCWEQCASFGSVARSMTTPREDIHPSLCDMVGIQSVVSNIMSDVLCAFHPHALVQRLCGGSHTLARPVGSLVVGSKGSGKSAVISSICESLRNSTAPLVNCSLVDCHMLHSEKDDNVCKYLTDVFTQAELKAPTVLFLDNIDAICGRVGDEEDPASDPNHRARCFKIVTHLSWLIDRCRATSRADEADAFDIFAALCSTTSSYPSHASCGNGSTVTPANVFISESVAICCADRIVGRATCRGVYIIATALHCRSVDPLLLSILSLGRKVVSIPSTRDARSRVEILRYAVSKLGGRLLLSAGDVKRLRRREHVQPVGNALEVEAVARLTEGYAPSDLYALAKRTVGLCLKKEACTDSPEPPDFPMVTRDDIEYACRSFLPACSSSLNLSTASNLTTFSSIGGYAAVKKVLVDTFQRPVMFRELYRRSGIRLSRGVMLYGPPGGGKTLLAQAAGNSCGLAFISVRGPELLDKYIGSSEKAVRSLFERAKAIGRPCLIFFDEFESLGARRGQDTTGVTDRVVNQLLTFLDGVEDTLGTGDPTAGQIFVVVATSRPDMVDPALIRPGRIETHVYVGFPTIQDRKDIFNTLLAGLKTSGDVCSAVDYICSHHKAKQFSGADIKGIVNSSYLTAVQDYIEGSLSLSYDVDDSNGPDQSKLSPNGVVISTTDVVITANHIMSAFQSTKPSISPHDWEYYENIYSQFKQGSSTDRNTIGQKTAFV